MLLALYILLLFHETLAGTRPLFPGEAIAFEAVFGTSRMDKLLEIAKDPVAYWEEREAALNDEAIPHIAFCKEYTRQARTYIQRSSMNTRRVSRRREALRIIRRTSLSGAYDSEGPQGRAFERKLARKYAQIQGYEAWFSHKPEVIEAFIERHTPLSGAYYSESLEECESRLKSKYYFENPQPRAIQREREREYAQRRQIPEGYVAWFAHKPEVIEEHIKAVFAEDSAVIAEDSPAYPTAVALFTAMACEHVDKPWKHQYTMKDETLFRKTVEAFKENKGLSREFNSRLYWVERKNAGFSIFDCLIMLRKLKYLCATAPFANMRDYKARQLSDGSFTFHGHSGPISHDAIGHARRQYLLEESLRDHGISSQEYFKQCWDKEKLIKNNIFKLGQQCLGCFYNFRELPLITNSWDPNNLGSLIFPTSVHLTDLRFLEIVPYFAPMDEHFDWEQTPLRPKDMDEDVAHSALLSFRDTYCRTQGDALLDSLKQES